MFSTTSLPHSLFISLSLSVLLLSYPPSSLASDAALQSWTLTRFLPLPLLPFSLCRAVSGFAALDLGSQGKSFSRFSVVFWYVDSNRLFQGFGYSHSFCEQLKLKASQFDLVRFVMENCDFDLLCFGRLIQTGYFRVLVTPTAL
ncbi:unnamed protein product [Camellia sinensis]